MLQMATLQFQRAADTIETTVERINEFNAALMQREDANTMLIREMVQRDASTRMLLQEHDVTLNRLGDTMGDRKSVV